MTFDTASFRALLGRFATGVTVVTTRDADGIDHGMTVSALCSLSLDPPLVLICIERTASMHDVLLGSSEFVVNILSEDQEPIARRFAEQLEDRFEGVGYARGVTGPAVLSDALAHIECTLVDRHPGGDHTICIGEVIAGVARSDRPLLYYRGGYTQMER